MALPALLISVLLLLLLCIIIICVARVVVERGWNKKNTPKKTNDVTKHCLAHQLKIFVLIQTMSREKLRKTCVSYVIREIFNAQF